MNKTEEFFDNRADQWDDHQYKRPNDDFRALIDQLDLIEGSKVVDLGCGTGVLIPHFLDKIGDTGLIYAVDISKKMLEQLLKKFTNEQIKTVQLKAEQLTMIEDKVDAVICFSAFPHIDDKKKALQTISKILKTNGKFLIAHFSSRHAINKLHTSKPEPICYHVLPDANEMRDLFEGTDFEIISLIDEPAKYELLAKKYYVYKETDKLIEQDFR
jgi:ubiquinone/menaquinone biosynthesis C-methylase UbiE